MPRSGLLAGLPGYAEVAEGPGKRIGEGIAGAVDQGLRAYGTTSRIRQGEEEGQRSQERLDMAQSLLPGQLRGQQLGNDTHALALQEAGDKITRQNEARVFGKTIQERMMKTPDEGGYADPKDFQLDMVKMTMQLGDLEHVKAAVADYKLLLDKSETAKQLGGAILTHHEIMRAASAAKTPEERISIGLNGLAKMYKDFPIGAAHPIMEDLTKNILQHADATQPKAVYDAVEKYQQLRVANPGLTPAQAWSRANENLHPGFLTAMEKLKPQNVKDDEKAREKGAEFKEKAAAEQPGKIELKKMETAATIEAANIRAAATRDKPDKAQEARDAKEALQESSLKKIEDFRNGRGPELTQTQVNALRKNAQVIQVPDPAMDTEYRNMVKERTKALPGILKEARDRVVRQRFGDRPWAQLTPAEKEAVAATIK